MERAVATLERNIKREEELAKNIPTDDLILFGQAKESTSQDMLIAQQYKQGTHISSSLPSIESRRRTSSHLSEN